MGCAAHRARAPRDGQNGAAYRRHRRRTATIDCLGKPLGRISEFDAHCNRSCRCAPVGCMTKGLVHKDHQPGTASWTRSRGRVWLTGFRDCLPDCRVSDQDRSRLGKWPAHWHMWHRTDGPENRSIDSPKRSCTLGVTFYEMLPACNQSGKPIRMGGSSATSGACRVAPTAQ